MAGSSDSADSDIDDSEEEEVDDGTEEAQLRKSEKKQRVSLLDHSCEQSLGATA